MYTFLRLLFFYVNKSNFPDATFFAFIYGMKFDLSAIFFTNLPYILAVLLPFSFCYKKLYKLFCNIYFILVNSFAALISLIDVAYYPYVQKRLSFVFFSYLGMGFDFQTLLPSFIKQFWGLFLLFVIIIVTLIYVIRFTNLLFLKSKFSNSFSKFHWFYNTLVLVVFSVFSFLCIRGGFQLRPISLIDTAKYVSIQNAAIVANTPFSLIHSYGNHDVIQKQYFDRLEEAELIHSPIINHIEPYNMNSYPVKNVIVIILESFSSYLINGFDLEYQSKEYQGFCPFLYDLQQRSISFNGIANGYRTLEALPAIFNGFPTVSDRLITQSPFANNFTYSPVQILRDKGYKTLFFHGAKNGSMQIESYCYSVGFEKYFGKNEYPYTPEDDGVWGISDRSYLQYVSQTLDKTTQPFFAGILTLSSHNPFTLPNDAKDLDIKVGTHPMQALASYTDYAIREFFEAISQHSWYDSTLFVVLGDHSDDGGVPSPRSIYMRYQIPLFFFHPLVKESKTEGIMQQMDIMPTIFSYLKINTPLFSYGNNRFEDSYTPYAINRIQDFTQFVTNDYLLWFDGEKSAGFFDIKNDILLKNNLLNSNLEEVEQYERMVKAILHSYTTRIVTNRMYNENARINRKNTFFTDIHK
jgi:phosphoglycerol transferase MdoB-like AlkP superfamily enzyme